MAPHDMLLTDRVAVVTGGGGGIGRAIALAFAAAGADIAVIDNNPERGEEVVARARALGRRGVALPVDVSQTGPLGEAFASVQAEFGRIDILVNNAGGVVRRPFVDQSERSWRRLIDLNFVSMLAATAAAVPIMIAGGRGGAIINVSSIEGTRAAPGYAIYAACKAAMNNFTRTMALELADERIRVNCIGPDVIHTPGTHGNLTGPAHDPAAWNPWPSDRERKTASRIPLRRVGDAEDIASVALFLASEMSRYMTGTILPVDGGAWASAGWIRTEEGDWSLTG